MKHFLIFFSFLRTTSDPETRETVYQTTRTPEIDQNHHRLLKNQSDTNTTITMTNMKIPINRQRTGSYPEVKRLREIFRNHQLRNPFQSRYQKVKVVLILNRNHQKIQYHQQLNGQNILIEFEFNTKTSLIKIVQIKKLVIVTN